MAVLARLSVAETSLAAGQRARFTLSILNTGSEAIDFARASVSTSGGSCNISSPDLAPGTTTGIPATSGTLAIPFSGTFFANMKSAGSPGELTNAEITVVAYTTTAAGVTSPVASNTVTVAITPNGGSGTAFLPVQAGVGQLRFDSNKNSLLFHLLF